MQFPCPNARQDISRKRKCSAPVHFPSFRKVRERPISSPNKRKNAVEAIQMKNFHKIGRSPFNKHTTIRKVKSQKCNKKINRGKEIEKTIEIQIEYIKIVNANQSKKSAIEMLSSLFFPVNCNASLVYCVCHKQNHDQRENIIETKQIQTEGKQQTKERRNRKCPISKCIQILTKIGIYSLCSWRMWKIQYAKDKQIIYTKTHNDNQHQTKQKRQ